jgi:hypothetical protein
VSADGWSNLFIIVPKRKAPVKPHSGRKGTPRRRNKVRLYSMLATIGLLLVILIGSYVALQPRVEDLPVTVPFRHEDWMMFVPSSAQFVAYVNYRSCMEATGNYSLFGDDPLLEIYSPSYALYATSIEYEVSVNLPSQGSKETSPTASVIKIGSQELKDLEKALQSSTILHKTNHGDTIIFDLLTRHKERNPQLASASLAITNERIVFAEGTGTANTIGLILDTVGYESRQLFSLESSRTAVYASGGSSGDYLALSVATFPTQIEGANMMMKTVKSASSSVTTQIALSFDSQEKAKGEYGAVRNLYSGGSAYWVLGPFVVAKFNHEISTLRDEIRGL